MKSVFFRILYYVGILNLLRFINKNKAIIIVYHGISEEAIKGPIRNSAYLHVDLKKFRQQIQYLKKKYNIISLENLCKLIKFGAKIPNYTVSITFDDGYRGVFDNAYPILRDYGVNCSVFLTSKLINNDDWLWLDKLEFIINMTNVQSLSILGSDYKLIDSLSKSRFLIVMRNKLKRLNEEDRKKVMGELILKLEADIPSHPCEEYRLMSYGQAQQMDSTIVSFGAHTPEHTILTLENSQRAYSLILESRQEISERLKKDVNLFSYPNGSYNNLIKDMLKKNGFICGLTTNYGMNDAGSDLFELKRISISSGDTLFSFIASLCGIRKYTDSFMRFLRKMVS